MKTKTILFMITLLLIQRICCENGTLKSRMQEQQQCSAEEAQGGKKRANTVQQRIVKTLRVMWDRTKVITAGIGLLALVDMLVGNRISPNKIIIVGRKSLMNTLLTVAVIAAIENLVLSHADLKNDVHDLKENLFCILEKNLGDKTEGSQ